MVAKGGDNVEHYPNFDFAIMAVFVRLVFEISTHFGNQRLKLQMSDYWSKTNERLENGLKAVLYACLQAIGVSMVIVIATAIGISIPSVELEERMTWIMTGLMFLFAAVVLGMLSFQVAFWTGLYPIEYHPPKQEKAKTIRELKVQSHCGIYRIFGRYFFFLMPFYQGVNAKNIPLSILAGILAGFVIDYGVYLARRRPGPLQKFAKYFFLFVVAAASSLCASWAAWYIITVFEDNEHLKQGGLDDKDRWLLVVFFLCLCSLASGHAFWYWYCHKQLVENTSSRHAHGLVPHRPRMAASLFFSKRTALDMEKYIDLIRAPTSQGLYEDSERDTNNGAEEDYSRELEASTRSIPAEPDLGAIEEVVEEEENDQRDLNEEAIEEPMDEEEFERPSYRELIRGRVSCCGCVRGDGRTPLEKAGACGYWTVWLVLVLLSLWLTLVNLGATVQQEAARKKLPYVHQVLYANMDEGPVCAFDNNGPDSNITTFANKDAAHEANFLVVHCGACGACSDWQNLRLEYTTREYLAEESAKCAKKSLTGGRQAVLDCLKKPEPIGFQGQCAECWVSIQRHSFLNEA